MKRYAGLILLVLLVCAVAFVALRPQPTLVEMGPVERSTVREYVSEEAKTQLAREYLIDLPESGTVEPIALEVGDLVQAGDVVARMETYELEQQLASVEAQMAQARAQVTGVDVAKPKEEDHETAAVRVRDAEGALAIAQKSLEVARIERDRTEKEYKRIQGLLAAGVISPSERDAAESAFLAAREQASSAELALTSATRNVDLARLAQQRLTGSIDDNEYMRQAHEAEIAALEAQRGIVISQLEKMVVKAPVSGPVLAKFEDSRRTLPAGSPLLRVGDLSSIEIACDVLSEEVGAISEGDQVELLGKAIRAENASGTVRRIHPAAFTKLSSLGIEQQRVRVLADFDNTELQLRPGTRIDVRIITAEAANVLAVPERATFRREGQHYVFRVEGGRARLTPITLGLRNDTWAEVKEGLSESDTIIYEPMSSLEDGALVAPK